MILLMQNMALPKTMVRARRRAEGTSPTMVQQTGPIEKCHRERGDEVPVPDLNDPGAHGDLRSSQVRALEDFEPATVFALRLLHVVGVLHDRDVGVDVVAFPVSGNCDLLEDLLRILVSAMTGKPPRA